VAAQRGLTYFNPFALTGLLGSFTTFSAFSLETMAMIERGQIWQAGVYILLSVFLSIGALAGGLFLARQVLT
jgi:CrcB protein